MAINRLGLSTISPFNPKERVALIILDLDMYESISYLFILEMVKLIKKIFLFVQYFPKVIEYSLPPPEEPQLIDLTVRQFVASVPISSRIFSSSTDPPPPPRLPQQSQEVHVSQVGARTAAPGGGSVSALLAALGAGLGSMVADF